MGEDVKDLVLRLTGTVGVLGLIVLNDVVVNKVLLTAGSAIIVAAIWAVKTKK